jgi:hypothetical protein
MQNDCAVMSSYTCCNQCNRRAARRQYNRYTSGGALCSAMLTLSALNSVRLPPVILQIVSVSLNKSGAIGVRLVPATSSHALEGGVGPRACLNDSCVRSFRASGGYCIPARSRIQDW